MLTWMFGVARTRPARRSEPSSRFVRLALENLEDRAVPATAFVQTNLVSDVANVAQVTDANLQNPWGLAVNPAGDFRVANAASGTVTLYQGDVNGSAFVAESTVIGTPIDPNQNRVAPTGMVFNSTTSFVVNGKPVPYIFAGLDGTLSATNAANHAQIVAAVQGAVYTGLAIGTNRSGTFLFAANPNGGRIDVFNNTFQQVLLAGNFADPNLSSNYAPFNVANVNGSLFVTYENRQDTVHGGVIDVFDTNGNLTGRFAANGPLNAPWAVAQAPASFGDFGNALLVGNFGDGHISAFDSTNGNYLGQLNGTNGQPVVIERLWQLSFGNGSSAGDAGTLYFTSGLNAEKDGLVGSLKPYVPPATGSFVNQLYLDLLNRPADAAGLAYWNGLLGSGVSRQLVVTQIAKTVEHEHVEVNSFYVKLLRRSADTAGLNYWSAKLAGGTTLEEIATGMAGSPEYYQVHGGTDGSFIASVYVDALGRLPEADGLAYFSAEMQGGVTSGQVASQIFASDEFKRDRIASFYQAFLRRAPEEKGILFFLSALKNGGRDEQVIEAIVASDEYFAHLAGLGNGSLSGGGSGGLWW